MPSQTYQEIPLTFEKGLILETEESVLGEGMAATLTNWTPEHTGGLRARNRWRAISETGLTDTTYNVRGWGSIGVGTEPTVVQTDSDNAAATTKTVSLTGVQAGSVVVVIGYASTGTVGATPTGFTEQAALSTNTFEVYTKLSAGGSETADVAFTLPSALNWAFMLEVRNISTTVDATDSDTASATSISTTPVATTDSSFAILYRRSSSVASGANTSPTMTMLASSNENATGTDPYSIGYTTSGLGGTNTYTWTNADTGSLVAGAVLFKATNRSSRSFYVVMANAVSGIKLPAALTATFVMDAPSATDSATYNITTTTVAPNASGRILFCTVVNRKATTPDTPTVSGTNAFSNTWTQVSTKLTDGGTRRLTVFWSTASSSTAGQITAAFGGATQLTGIVSLFEMLPTDITAASPTVQAVTASGTGTAVTATLAAFASAANAPAIFVVTAATGAGTMSVDDADFTEVQEDAQAEGLAYGAFVGYDSANLTPGITLSGSVEWAAIAVELNTEYVDTGYRIWQLAESELAAGTWTQLDEVGNVADNTALVSFAQGAGALVYTSDQMTYPRAITLTTSVAANITAMSTPGRAVCYHKNRFFITGSLANPARVHFSGLADETTWGINSYFDLNADDGETAEDMVSVEGLLLVAKTEQTFLISGSGIESFFVNSLSGGSSATGRSLAKTPYGTILAGTNDVWSVQGGGIDPLSRPLGNGYSISGYVSTAYASDKVYILDSGTSTIYVQDLTTGSWSLESVTHTDTPHLLFSVGRTLIYGCDNATTYLGGYRSLADTRVGDEPATSTAYAAATGVTFLLGPQVKYTPRHLFLQVRRQGATPQNLTVTVETPGGSHAFTVAPTATVKRERLDIGFAAGAAWIQVNFAQTCTPGQYPDDIERVILGVDVERIR